MKITRYFTLFLMGSTLVWAADVPADSASAPTVSLPAWAKMDLPSLAPAMVVPEVGGTYFTRFSLHQEEGNYPTTNYARGPLVPINTSVKVVSMKGDKMLLQRLDTNEKLEVKNVAKFTGKTMVQFAGMMLSSQPTPLDRWPKDLAAAIRAGELHRGMTKEQVLMARGYPPAHETSSTESDRWVYWSSRFVKQTIVFHDGRLMEGRDLL